MSKSTESLQGLMQLSRARGVDIRPTLLRTLTDLFIQEPRRSRELERQYVELALRLLPVVDASTRSAVARRLADSSSTPEPLRELTDRALRESGHVGLQRPSTRDVSYRPTFNIDEPPDGFRSAGITPESSGESFLRATAEVRRTLLTRAEEEIVPRAVNRTLPTPAGFPERLAEKALARDRQGFAQELQMSLGLPSRVAWRIVQDDTGEPLLAIARAVDMPEKLLLRILLFLNPQIGESVQRVFTLVRFYDRVTMAAASALVASWRSPLARAPRFQPLHAPDSSLARGLARGGAEPLRTNESAAPAGPRVTPGRRQATT
jgi:Uncharacterised protein conserved in bacteria (DUF2336)